MRKLFLSKPKGSCLTLELTLTFIGLLIAFCHLCTVRAQTPISTAGEPTRKSRPDVKSAAEPTNIVARIGDNVITKQELKKRLMMELYPDDYDYYNEQAEPADAESVLMKMIAEKAMVAEARKQGYLKDEESNPSIKRFREKQLVNLLLSKHLQEKIEKIKVTESEIQQSMKANPKLDHARAKAMLERTKAIRLIDQYYKQLYQKFHVKKISDNFPKAAQIHERLLKRPKKPRKVGFIRISQIKDDLTPQEKDIVLAEYDNGRLTLKDWLDTLCNFFSPPSRPKDLNTPEGVERFLEIVLRMPLFVSEAKLLGLDKDKNLLERIKDNEDGSLLSKVKSERHGQVKEPAAEQIIAYFGKNKEAFRTDRSLKIDLIWCQDLKTARKAKAELDDGEDFESVKQKYSLEKKIKPFDTYPGSEGLFWKDLWKNDPNEIVGPLKGFYRSAVKWRIVKILEKKPGELKEYSSDMEQRVKEAMLSEQREAILAKYGKELLEKYPHKVYTDRIKDINPLDIQ